MLSFLAASLYFLPLGIARFVTVPQDLLQANGNGIRVRFKEVPKGICETVEGVHSYSGFIDVEQHQHLFFYFTEARNQDPKTAPLTLWLNGGPGDPSLVGLFSEHGPCWIDSEGEVNFNEYSWSNVSNMLYIDQPTDTGLSYSELVNGFYDQVGTFVATSNDTCPDIANGTYGTYSSSNAAYTVNSTLAAAPYVWKALQGFIGAFPSYASNGVYLSSESYGGHYAPVFAEYILAQNARKIPGTSHIDLRGVSVGNGWVDPIIQFQAYYNFTMSPGNTYSYKPFNESTRLQMYNALYGKGNCVDQLNDCNYGSQTDEVCLTADNYCYDQVEYLYDIVTSRDEYDLRELTPDPFPYTHFVAYLNKAEVQMAMGAFTNFSYATTNLGRGTVSAAFASTGDDARTFDIIARNRRLVEQGLYVVHYAGDADYNCNWVGGEEVARQIDVPGWSSAGYENLTTIDNAVHGVAKQSGLYSFVRVYDSGHQVPFYKPRAALEILERMLKRRDIATGQEQVHESYRSIGPAKSEYQNDAKTIQTDVIDESCVFDTQANMPVCDGECRD